MSGHHGIDFEPTDEEPEKDSTVMWGCLLMVSYVILAAGFLALVYLAFTQ
jgi:hypothetical protein